MSEQGVDLETEGGKTRLGKQPGLQKFAAKDFLRLGRASEHVEWAYYYEYRGPKRTNEFDSALLKGEGHEPEDWRPAYCVLALGKEVCPAKSVTKAPITDTTTSSASTVMLDVNPEEAATTYSVEYGTTEAYGKTTAATSLPNENGEQSETVRLKGLEPCTTYHYQAEAENEANEGTPGRGGDQTFTTACLTPAVDVSAGGETTCATLENGHVDCWGSDYEGILGNGTRTEPETCSGVFVGAGCSAVPVGVADITNATAVSVGQEVACALLSTGHVDCWGFNQIGQLGDGPDDEKVFLPVQVSGISDATAVTVSYEEACALLSDGQAACWGGNAEGGLGDGTSEASSTPVMVSGLTEATAISAGQYDTCALLASGGVDCWGGDFSGLLGDETSEPSLAPVPVSGITNATAITLTPQVSQPFIGEMADSHACALLSGGEVECWGSNGWGELGNGTTGEMSSTPVLVSGITNATAISASQARTCAVLSSGSIDCWGNDEYGQLGDGESNGSPNPTPERVTDVTNAIGVSAGNFDGCALLSGGSIECWGFNEDGRLGDDTFETSSTSSAVQGIG